ncbi:MAG: halogenase [Lysobacteraceae bacterium]|nr:MAG: halogenase [Xanthomonadaceae bacterium]
MTSTYDATIVGGGLAGLTLALQLRKRCPDLSIAIIERNRFPVPASAHKVGESTVEIGAHYLSNVLGLSDQLKQNQLPKYGLRFYFGEGHQSVDERDELGPSRLLSIPSFQLDRGILENDLAELVRNLDVDVFDGCKVHGIKSTEGQHHLVARRHDGSALELKASWVIDCASRTSPLKRTLGLAKSNDHVVNSAWFRVPTSVRVDNFSDCPDWQSRFIENSRWLSTNHFMGQGYWVWLIPLSTGATSVGIVADPSVHPLDTFNRHDRAMQWFADNEPNLLPHIDGLEPMDFRFLKDYSHDCKQVFGAEQWALSGEAGVFLDPFYSPGTDFIAISNTYITDLIARQSHGEPITQRRAIYQHLFLSFYNSSLELYQGQYPGFGDRNLMILKLIWDYTYYWGVLAFLFYRNVLTDLDLMTEFGPLLADTQRAHRKMQKNFRERARQQIRKPGSGRFFDQYMIPILRELNKGLAVDCERDQVGIRLRENVSKLMQVGDLVTFRLQSPGAPLRPDEAALIGDLQLGA